jgi:hypothetical protein
MLRFASIALAVLMPAFLCAQQTAQQHASQFRERFAKETDPLHKAQLMPEYGDLEFHDIQEQLEQDELTKALDLVKQFRDEARTCAKGLEAKVANPEKHPNGFKQLQFSVRQALRRLGDIIHSLPGDDQKPFLEVRRELDELDHQLVHELFPNQPG